VWHLRGRMPPVQLYHHFAHRTQKAHSTENHIHGRDTRPRRLDHNCRGQMGSRAWQHDNSQCTTHQSPQERAHDTGQMERAEKVETVASVERVEKVE